MLRSGLKSFYAAALLAALAPAQKSSPTAVQPAAAPTLIKTIRVVEDGGSPALEILSAGKRVIPEIQTLNSPPRLIIDLPNSRLIPAARRTAIQKGDVQAILSYQYQKRPPVTRIILDLLAACSYSWDVSQNRLFVRLHPPENRTQVAAPVRATPNPSSEAPPPTVTAISGIFPRTGPAALPVTGGPGALVVAGARLAAGSTLTAGTETAVLRLARGGAVYVCPGTSVSFTPAHHQRDLMLGLSVGSLEAHYSLRAAADTVLTPDFRITFSGPGHFDFAISADSHGNTCVRALAGNMSSAIVSELLGDRIYQVRPAEQAVFRNGRIDRVDTEIPPVCGCPPPPPVMRAEPYGPPLPDSLLPEKTRLGGTSALSKNGEIGTVFGPTATTTLSSGPETAPLPPSQPNSAPVEVEAPLVFTARSRAAVAPPVPSTSDLPLQDRASQPVYLDAVIQSPPPEPPANAETPAKTEAKPEHRGFFRRIGGFFSHIFGKSSSQ